MKKIYITSAVLAVVLLVPSTALCQMGDGDSNDTNASQSDGNSLNSFGSPSVPSNDAAPPDNSNYQGDRGGRGGHGGGDAGGCQDSPENSTLILAVLAGGTFGLFELSRHLKSRKRLRNVLQLSRI